MSKTTGCETCRYCVRQDTGYSNYTVTGTDMDCLLGENPKMPVNDDVMSIFYDALVYGETCSARSDGDGPWFDCDRNVTVEDFKSDEEIYALLKKWSAA